MQLDSRYGLVPRTVDRVMPGNLGASRIVALHLGVGLVWVVGLATVSHILLGHAGPLLAVEIAIAAAYVLVTAALLYYLVHRDLERERQARERIHAAARTDELTGLLNRSSLQLDMDTVTAEARSAGVQLGAIFLDVDRLKEVNDLFGHTRGDEVIQEVGRRLTGCVGPGSLLYRAGGDEFMVITAPVSDGDALQRMAEYMVHILSQEPYMVAGRTMSLSSSAGIAIFPRDASSASELLRTADVAMYAAKRAGGNRTQRYSSDLDEAQRRLHSLAADLQAATGRGELFLEYQPITSEAQPNQATVEALVRWRHPERGVIPPNEFIPIAEERGLIQDLGFWVIEETARQIREWERQGARIRVAVNLAAAQLQDPAFPDTVSGILASHGVHPSRVEFEITERSIVDTGARGVAVLHGLRALGAGVVIDDFGVGYSALSYLRSLPLTAVKLDRSFVASLLMCDRDRVVVRGIVELGHALGLRVIAEGIETQDQLLLLRHYGCDAFQGFLLGRPQGAGNVLEALRTRQADAA